MNAVTTTLLKTLRDHWIVVLVFFICSTITVLTYQLELRQLRAKDQVLFERESQIVKTDVEYALQSYGLFVRNQMALFLASDEVTRDDWAAYMKALDLANNYPGILAVAYGPLLQGEAEAEIYSAGIRATDWSEFTIYPEGDREFYVPVLYVEPMNKGTSASIGFDMHSEVRRERAIQHAIRTGKPSLSAPITLVSEDEYAGGGNKQPGFLLIMPVYEKGMVSDGSSPLADQTTGLLVSVFRMGAFMDAVFETLDASTRADVNLEIFDSAQPDPGSQLYATAANDEYVGRYSDGRVISVFGRKWILNSQSTRKFDDTRLSLGPSGLLVGGILGSLLLTSLMALQAQRIRETRRVGAVFKAKNDRIEFLLSEVNHRSKNLLALVQAIARQTSIGSPNNFAKTFANRLSALSASQDLLIDSQWTHTPLADLVKAQLVHFEGMMGNRIFLKGEAVELSSTAAQTLGMAIHELATNAAKYGALSNDQGTITIDWRCTTEGPDQKMFEMSWVERNGPVVQAPESTGFGTTVSQTMVKMSLSGDVNTAFEAAGFHWHLKCPVHQIKYAATDSNSPAEAA